VRQVATLTAAYKIITHDESLTVQNPFSTKTLHWKDITEFGTYTIGYEHRIRLFYIKSTKFSDAKIKVCNEHLKDLKDLIDTIFLRAINAKFVVVENVALIPFTKRYQVVPWDRNDRSIVKT